MTEYEQLSGLSIYIVVRMVMSCACRVGVIVKRKGERTCEHQSRARRP